MADRETYSTKGAVCPHCGYFNDPANDNYRLYDEATSEWECGGCDTEFRVGVYVSHSWTCAPKENQTNG